jgi:amino acid transporter
MKACFSLALVTLKCVMEGICEMIVLWPISNAMIEFVRAFVDEDLAIVVGIAYWYQSLWIFKFALQDTTF